MEEKYNPITALNLYYDFINAVDDVIDERTEESIDLFVNSKIRLRKYNQKG